MSHLKGSQDSCQYDDNDKGNKGNVVSKKNQLEDVGDTLEPDNVVDIIAKRSQYIAQEERVFEKIVRERNMEAGACTRLDLLRLRRTETTAGARDDAFQTGVRRPVRRTQSMPSPCPAEDRIVPSSLAPGMDAELFKLVAQRSRSPSPNLDHEHWQEGESKEEVTEETIYRQEGKDRRASFDQPGAFQEAPGRPATRMPSICFSSLSHPTAPDSPRSERECVGIQTYDIERISHSLEPYSQDNECARLGAGLAEAREEARVIDPNNRTSTRSQAADPAPDQTGQCIPPRNIRQRSLLIEPNEDPDAESTGQGAYQLAAIQQGIEDVSIDNIHIQHANIYLPPTEYNGNDPPMDLAYQTPSSSSHKSADISNCGLVEAREVQDNNQLTLMHAKEVDPLELQRKLLEAKKVKQRMRQGFFLVAIAVVILLITVIVQQRSKDIPAYLPHSMSPSIAQSQSPSAPPTGALDLLLLDLPTYTVQSLRNFSTPQWKAKDWLSNHPDLEGMPEWRKKQLFALVTFYYAMGGPNWPKAIRDGWIIYEKSECFWFSSEFGDFRVGSSGWDESVFYNNTPCNEQEEFQLLVLCQMDLSSYIVSVPPEITLLTALSVLDLSYNDINATMADFLPSQLYQMSKIEALDLSSNSFHGFIPTELGLMTSMTSLKLSINDLAGEIPSQVGFLSNMLELGIAETSIIGLIPTELGLMANMTKFMRNLYLYSNSLSGNIPSQLGLMANMFYLRLDHNALTGLVPTELGSLTSMKQLYLHSNRLSGELPSQFGLLNNMVDMKLGDNALNGTIPQEMSSMGANGTLARASFANNIISGTVPDSLCLLGRGSQSHLLGLLFDCGNQFCGCCWCPCKGVKDRPSCPTEPVLPTKSFNGWPGLFPTPLNSTNVVTLNFYTDDFPHETTLEWSTLNVFGAWEILESQYPQDVRALHTYTMEVESNATYKLQVLDSYDDGTCCGPYGFGWFTITNSTRSYHGVNGTIIWGVPGDFYHVLEVFLWIDPTGHAHHVQYFRGEGFALVLEGSARQELIIVVPEMVNVENSSATTQGPKVPQSI